MITVVYCFDKNYAHYAAVSTYSLFVNSRSDVKVYWISPDPKNIEIIPVAESFKTRHWKVHVIPVGPVTWEYLNHWKIARHFTPAMYLRFLIPALIPDARVIYLDADTLVVSDLGKLYSTSLNGNLIAGVLDPSGSEIKVPRLAGDPYLNSGVLLMDLAALRNDRILEKSEAVYLKHKDKLLYPDQDIINKYAEGRKLVLQICYNCMIFTSRITEKQFGHLLQEKDLSILHFLGPVKPWHKGNNPGIEAFWKHYENGLYSLSDKNPATGVRHKGKADGSDSDLRLPGNTARRKITTQKEPSVITVVYCFDKNYAHYAAVSTYSLFINSRTDVKVYWIIPGHEKAEVIPIADSFKKQHWKVHVIPVGPVTWEYLNRWKIARYFTPAMYLRFLIPALIPDAKVIYLDADTLVVSDLGKLYSTSLDGNLIAGVLDPGASEIKVPRLAGDPYLNSGVLLMDLTALRNDRMLEKSEAVYLKHKDELLYPDQDIINKYAEGRKLVLQIGYNFMIFTSHINEEQFRNLLQEKSLSILHFFGAVKPWHKGNKPYAEAFWKHYENGFYALSGKNPPTGIRRKSKADGSASDLRLPSNNARRKITIQKEPSVITVVYCFDKKFAHYAAVSTYSLFVNSRSDIKVYWITPDHEKVEVIPVADSFKTRRWKVHVIPVGPATWAYLNRWKISEHYTPSMYLRFLIPALIPDASVIYLDADTLVVSDLGKLYSTNLAGNLIAGVRDPGAKGIKGPGLAGDPYLNSGVLLMDLAALRNDQMLEKVESIYLKHKAELLYPDQDIINKYAEGRKLELPMGCNRLIYIPHITEKQFRNLLQENGLSILHFVGAVKPWQKGNNPCVEAFWKHYEDGLYVLLGKNPVT